MSLDSLEAAFAAPPQPRRQCKVCDILTSLGDRAGSVKAAIAADPRVWPNATIAKRLTDAGFPVGTESVRKHRMRLS